MEFKTTKTPFGLDPAQVSHSKNLSKTGKILIVHHLFTEPYLKKNLFFSKNSINPNQTKTSQKMFGFICLTSSNILIK